jgi:hypothetical protein
MTTSYLPSNTFTLLVICFLLIAIGHPVRTQAQPFTVFQGLFDQSNEDSLGLSQAAGTETVTVFSPTDSTDQYSNGVVMTAFKGFLYCQWQSSATDEDAPDTWVAYSRSQDGHVWTEPMELVPSIPDGYVSSGGWWVAEDTLVAYLNTWPDSISPRGGYTRYVTSTDGLTWSEPQPLLMANGDTLNGIFEQDPRALPGGRIISAAHFQPGLIVSPIYTDDQSGTRGWIKADFTNLSQSGNVSRELEPSWYRREDDAVVMTFRDQNGSYRRLASVSLDSGETWATPVLTSMPDSRSKQSAGNLPDGKAFLVGNPRTDRTRIPLAVTLSGDGQFFNTAYVLRKGGEGLQPLRFEGLFKREGYHYPKSFVWNDTLYVSYATNKEDVEFTQVPVASLILDSTVTHVRNPALAAHQDIQILMDGNQRVRVSLSSPHQTGTVKVMALTGKVIFQKSLQSGELLIDLTHYPKGLYVVEARTPFGKKARLLQN